MKRLLFAIPLVLMLSPPASAEPGDWLGDPNTPFWQAPGASENELNFLNCVALGESSGDPAAVSPSGTYRGAFQFKQTTQNGVMERWEHGDYRGVPMNEVPIDVQYRTALLLLRERGWHPWPTTGRECQDLL